MKHIAKNKTSKVSITTTTQLLTTQAGMVPVISFINQQKFYSQLKNTLTLQRSANAGWQLEDTIHLVAVGIIAGAESLSSVKAIWADSVLGRVDGWKNIPDDTTLSRIFKECSQKEVKSFQALIHRFSSKVREDLKPLNKGALKRRESHFLDVDSTVKTVYGQQEGAEKGYNPEKPGALSYHPLLAFYDHTKEIIQGEFRKGSAYTSHGVVEFIKQIQANFRGQRIIFRGDSGFFSGDLLSELEANNDGYIVKVKFRNLKSLLERQKWRSVRNHSEYQQCMFEHTCSGWKQPRTFAAVRKVKPKIESNQLSFYNPVEYEYFCYVKSEGFSPWKTHKIYGKRATCETWIEESKNQMALAHIKTNSFVANSMIFQCSILAYNILRWMAALSNNKKLKRWEPKTIRCFLIRVAGKLVTSSRQLVLKTPENLLFENQWQAWLKFST